MARQMIRWRSGEVQVIDLETMTASEPLHHSEQDAPLDEYELDLDLDGRELDPNGGAAFTVVRDMDSHPCVGDLATPRPWTVDPLGEQKHYGTKINGGSITVWQTQGDLYPEGDAAPSHRDRNSEHDRLGGHYESVADLANAEMIVRAVNSVD